MEKITVEKPVRICVRGREKLIRAGSVVSIDKRRVDYYGAYPIVVSPDIAEQYLGYTPEVEEEPTIEEYNGE